MKNQQTSFETKEHFLQNKLSEEGKLFYVPENFDTEILIQKINNWFEKENNLKIKQSQTDDIKIITYQKKRGLKSSLGLSGVFQLFLQKKEKELKYEIKHEKWLSEWNQESKFSFKKFIQDSLEDEITDFIAEHISKTYFADIKRFTISENNRYIEDIEIKHKIWFYNQRKENEILLAFLNISNVKQIPGEAEIDNKLLSWKYILTSEKSILLALNEENKIEKFYDLSGHKMKVEKSITKANVEIGKYQWNTNLNNSRFYSEINNYIDKTSEQKIYEFAKLNWLYNVKKIDEDILTTDFLSELRKRRNNPFDELSMLFVEMSKGKKEKIIEKYTKDEKLTILTSHLFTDEKMEQEIIFWIDEWQLSVTNQVTILRLLHETAENTEQLSKILPLHTEIRKKFIKFEKDAINQIIFDIAYCKHLIKCEHKEEAKKILNKHLKKLPDETLSDILPPPAIDLTSDASGQILRVSILELLSEAQEKQKSVETLLQIAKLQPLSKKRLEDLLAVAPEELKEKVQTVRNLLEPEVLGTSEESYEKVKFQKIKEADINQKLKHPATRKGAMFGSIQKWIAKVQIPDYTVIKSYSELLTSKKYPEISAIITDIKVALGLENIETYIARGDKSIGITSFEGTPSFLIIGSNHIDTESPYYLNYSELEYAIGLELAHLYFKHSRITSTDIWRGAMDKGTWVLDAVLSVIPFIGTIGSALSKISKLNSVALFLQKTNKLQPITSKSKNIFETTTQAVNLFKNIAKKDSEQERKQELIAISRILMLTADRAGLLFTGDLKSAIRSIFITSKTYINEFPTVERYGINEFLLKKDNKDLYKHHDLAIRFASLFAFYFSDEYVNLRNTIIKKNT